MILTLTDICAGYGGIDVLQHVSISVAQGEFVAIVGPNGAGKTTLFKTISGIVEPRQGSISFNGENLLSIPPPQRAHLGLAHVPEGRRVFKDLSVTENLLLGAFTRDDQEGVREDLASVFDRFPRLSERKNQTAGTMSGGEQQMLSIGRALMSKPRILLLDEPSLGLAPNIVREIAYLLTEINDQGVSIVLVEQNAELALELARHGYVLETGNVALEGEARGLMDNDHVRKAYLGI